MMVKAIILEYMTSLMCFVCILSINLIYQISVSNCEMNFQVKGIEGIRSYENIESKSILRTKRDKSSNELKVAEIVSLTSESPQTSTQTINEPLIDDYDSIESNSTSDPILLSNETDVTTPSLSFANESLVSMVVYDTNETLNDSHVYQTTHASHHSMPPISTTYITVNISEANPTTEIPFTESPTTLTHTSNQSTIISTTESSTTNAIENDDIDNSNDIDVGLNEEICIFQNQIQCKNIQISCYGWGEIDCGSRLKRSINYSIDLDDDSSDLDIYKLNLEKSPQSEYILNDKCVLTAHENKHFHCKPEPMLNECKGKTVCKPKEKSAELNGPMELWKVGLIAGLTATGGIIFIVVAVVAYISYNKLKVRPESTSMNGYHNNPQSVTRV